MSGQNANLNVTFTSSGAGSVIGDAEAVQAALSGITGGSVGVSYESKGAAGATREAQAFSNAMGDAKTSAAGMGRETERAARSAAGIGREASSARGHVQGLRDDFRSAAEHAETVAGHMTPVADGASRARQELSAASRSMGELSTGAGQTSQGMRQIGADAQASTEHVTRLASAMQSAASFAVTSSGRVGSDAGVASRLPRGDQTGTRASNFAVDSSGQSSSRLSGANKEMELFGQRAGGVSAAISGSGKEMERFRSSSAGAGNAIEAFNTRVVGGAGSSAEMGSGPRSGWNSNSFEYTQGGKEAQAGAAARKARQEAASAGGTPWARKAAEDIDEVGKSSDKAKSKSLDLGSAFGKVSNAGWQMAAVAGAMAGVTSEAASMTKSTAGLGMSLDGMNSMLTRTEQVSARGAIGGRLSAQDSQLRQSARTMTSELTPAIKSSIGAVGAMENAKMGAWGSLGPQIAGFANTVKSSAPGMQSMMQSIGGAALNLGSDVVAGVSQSAPAWQQLAQTVANNGPQLAAGAKDVSDVIAGVGQVGVWAGAAADTLFKAADPSSSIRAEAQKQQGSRNLGTSNGFDPSKPFSGTAIGPDGSETTGSGTGSGQSTPQSSLVPPQSFRDMAKAGGHSLPMTSARQPSKDAAKYDGMSPKQIHESQFQQATGGYPSTGPYPSGLGAPPPRVGGPGASAGGRQISPAIAATTGASGPVLADMMSAASKQVSSGGGLGQAAEQHITKAVHQASPAASSGGASVGAAFNSGMAQGHQSTQSVVDTMVIKHSKHIIDIASAALGVHSPSTEFDYLGRMTMSGFGQGLERQASSSFGQMDGILGAHQSMASKYAATYAGAAPGVTVSVPKPNQAMQYSSQSANQNIDAHNERASRMAAGREQRQRWAIGGNESHDERQSRLLQNRANNHERALANLRVPGHTTDSNPFAADQANASSRRSGLNAVINPFHNLGLKSAGTEHGQNLAQGVSAGIKAGTPATVAQVSKFGSSVQAQHKKVHGIQSPSTVFAADGMNMAAGVGMGFSAGMPAATSEMSTAAQSMSMALQGPLSDYGLQAGYTYVQAFADGSSRELKKADTQALGEPSNLSNNAMSNLATGGFLRAGSGASTWKTNSGGNGVVTLGGAPSSLTINVPGQDIVIGDDAIATIADRQIELAFNAATGTYDTL